MRVKDLKVGEKIIIKNKHEHIKIFLVESIKNRHCSMHGDYLGKEHHLRKVRCDGNFGSISIYSDDSEIDCEKLDGDKIPACQCSGCNQQKTKTIKQDDKVKE